MLESEVLRQCQDYLKLKGMLHWRSNNIPTPLKGGGFRRFGGLKGLADIIAVLPPYGTILAIECKRSSGGRQSAEQKAFEAEVKKAGGVYLLVRDINELINFFRNTYEAIA